MTKRVQTFLPKSMDKHTILDFGKLALNDHVKDQAKASTKPRWDNPKRRARAGIESSNLVSSASIDLTPPQVYGWTQKRWRSPTVPLYQPLHITPLGSEQGTTNAQSEHAFHATAYRDYAPVLQYSSGCGFDPTEGAAKLPHPSVAQIATSTAPIRSSTRSLYTNASSKVEAQEQSELYVSISDRERPSCINKC